MTAAVARDVSITYAGVTLGGTSDYILDGPFTLELAYERLLVRCQVVLSSDVDEATFLTAEAALLAAFRTPRGTISVLLGVTNRGGTGFDAQPTISKVGSLTDTGQSARYVIEVTARRQADLSGQAGRFDSRSQMVIGPNGQKLVQLTGQYTSLGADNAFEQWEDELDAFCSSRLTLFGLTSGVNVETITDEVIVHDSLNVADFVRVYKQILSNQSVGLLNDPSLKDATLVVTRGELDLGANSSLAAARALDFVAEYHVQVDSTVTTDLSGTWENKVKPLLVAEIQHKAQAGLVVVTGVIPRFHVASNEISATVTGLLYSSSLVEFSIEVEDQDDLGVELLPVWDDNPHSKDRLPGIAMSTRVMTFMRLTTDQNPGLPGYSNPDDTPNQSNYVEVERARKRRRVYVGVRSAGGVQQLLYEEVRRTFIRADKPKSFQQPKVTPATPPRETSGSSPTSLSPPAVTDQPRIQFPLIFLPNVGLGATLGRTGQNRIIDSVDP